MFITPSDVVLAVAAEHRRDLLDDATRFRLARTARRAARRRTSRAAAEAARAGSHLRRSA
jgi:hypothetical protein